jgi:adenylate cyclase
MLNEYFGDMTPIVFEHGGLLDKYIGDGLMALFGVPYPSADAAEKAVAAAIAMQRQVVRLSEELVAAGLPELRIGIGLNTGTVTLGYVGTEQRTEYTAIGDAVNLAARLEHRAEGGQVLITRSTLEAVGDRFGVKPVGEVKVKGKNTLVEVFEVMW